MGQQGWVDRELGYIVGRAGGSCLPEASPKLPRAFKSLSVLPKTPQSLPKVSPELSPGYGGVPRGPQSQKRAKSENLIPLRIAGLGDNHHWKPAPFFYSVQLRFLITARSESKKVSKMLQESISQSVYLLVLVRFVSQSCLSKNGGYLRQRLLAKTIESGAQWTEVDGGGRR